MLKANLYGKKVKKMTKSLVETYKSYTFALAKQEGKANGV